MEQLLEKSASLVQRISTEKKRYLFNEINWNNRLIGVKGARGTGKTTLLLQKLKELGLSPTQGTYWSLDDFYTFEIGGKDKTSQQINTIKNSFIVADDLEFPISKLPLWLFGFLYYSDQF